MNKKYYINVEALTPICVGAGAESSWKEGIDYVVGHDQKLYHINLRKVKEQGFDMDVISDFLSKKKDRWVLTDFFGEKLYAVSDKSFDLPAKSSNGIVMFIKNQLTGNPVIPGSSLKGAIRSVIYKYLRGGDGDTRKKESDFFGKFDAGDDFFRFIQVSDIDFESTRLVNSKIFNLRIDDNKDWKGGWKNASKQTDETICLTKFNTIYETLVPNQKGFGSIALSLNLYDLYKKNVKQSDELSSVKRPIVANDISFLFHIINQHTKNYLLKELAFFSKYEAERTDEVVKNINSLIELIPQDDDSSYCIIKMAAGSGFHSMTGDWQYDDYDKTGFLKDKKKYKSRKIAIDGDHLSLMGFVEISVLSADELKDVEQEREKKREDMVNEIKEKEIKREKLEQEKAVSMAEKKLKETQYNDLISKGKAEVRNESWIQAQNYYLAAKLLFPNKNDVGDDLIDDIKKKIVHNRKIEESQKLKEILDKSLQDRYQQELNIFIDHQTKLHTLFSQVIKWMNKNNKLQLDKVEQQVLFDKIKNIYLNLKTKEQKGWNSKEKWKELNKIVSDETIASWFGKIVGRAEI